MRIALYQPDIPQNTGAILRTAACLGAGVDVIGPVGFDMTDRALRRAGLDYLGSVELVRHADWTAFETARAARASRLVLATTKASVPHTDAAYVSTDTLLFGRESAGVPDAVHAAADLRVRIPLVSGTRSLNVAVSVAIVLAEALRQTGGFAI